MKDEDRSRAWDQRMGMSTSGFAHCRDMRRAFLIYGHLILGFSSFTSRSLAGGHGTLLRWTA